MQKYFLVILALVLSLTVNSEEGYKSDLVYSTYKDKTHSTRVSVTVDVPKEVCMSMVADLIDQFRGDPQELFEWAFKGIGKQEGEDNEKNEVLIELNQAIYDKKSEIGTLIIDIKVPGLTEYKDVEIKSKVSQYQQDSLVNVVGVDVFYSNALLKKTYGTFFVERISGDVTKLSMEINVRFGWFFNIFISKRRYKNLVEWRADEFMNNLREEGLRRVGELEQ